MSFFCLPVRLGAIAILTLISPVAVAQSLTPPVTFAQAQTLLDEETVESLMEQVKAAEYAEDVDQLASFLAPFVFSEITVESGDRRITQTMEGAEAHEATWRKVYAQIKEQELLNEKINIRIVEDGQLAIVTRFSVETLTLEDQRQMMAMAKEVVRVALIGGKPKIISVNTSGWLEERPSLE